METEKKSGRNSAFAAEVFAVIIRGLATGAEGLATELVILAEKYPAEKPWLTRSAFDLMQDFHDVKTKEIKK